MPASRRWLKSINYLARYKMAFGKTGAVLTVDSAFTLNSVLWKSIAKKKSANLAFLDLTKAYDSVFRETLWKKLSKMGFGRQFLEALKSLYKGDYVTCDANGVSSKPVYLGRGLRQGCS